MLDNFLDFVRIERDIVIFENIDVFCLLLNVIGFLVRLELKSRTLVWG